MVDFVKISELIAARFKCEFNFADDSKQKVFLDTPTPVILEVAQVAGGLQWFKIVALAGAIVDPNAFDPIQLLRMNNKRESQFAIRETNGGPVLALMDRYPVPVDSSAAAAAEILASRTISLAFPILKETFPGVEQIE